MTEQWRAVIGYEGSYEVSDLGNVRSRRRVVHCADETIRIVPERQLKPITAAPSGYKSVVLAKGGRTKMFRVHRLVLEAFVGGRPEGMECRHLNDIPCDNRLENLAWGTSSENKLDIVRNGNHHYAKRTHCAKGHEFTVENTLARNEVPSGRRCRTCKNERERIRYHREKASA
ncbi:hypothetical protein DQP57_00435 [Mycobacterium colombiense]|uniref:HNH endonuclease n=1 Tax=Mycobacterium colombiense TaxID=339268 RepID=A0A329ME36_9MYCO|nr:hypothetical protein DQP57_00435 [Mycobacterium colombiense]